MKWCFIPSTITLAHKVIPFPKAIQANKSIGNIRKYVLSSLPAFFHEAEEQIFPRVGSALSDHILNIQGEHMGSTPPEISKSWDFEFIKIQ